MEKLDRLVTKRLVDRRLTPERVAELLASLRKRQSAQDEDHAPCTAALKSKLVNAENRLYAAIESGIADLRRNMQDDQVAKVRGERGIVQTSLDCALAETDCRARITDDKSATFVDPMRPNVLNGDTLIRRAYIRSVVDQVEADDGGVRIHDRRPALTARRRHRPRRSTRSYT